MAEKTQKSRKGNPANHRMGNPNLKARRGASWQRGQRRKEARRKAQAEREAKNKDLRAAGLPTPWEARVGLEAIERMSTARARRRERDRKVKEATR